MRVLCKCFLQSYIDVIPMYITYALVKGLFIEYDIRIIQAFNITGWFELLISYAIIILIIYKLIEKLGGIYSYLF